MNEDNVSKSLNNFRELMNSFLEKCQTEEEKKAFLIGIFLASHAFFRFANPDTLKPFQRECFMASIRTGASSDLNRLGESDIARELRVLLQEDLELEGMASSYRLAACLQKIMGNGLDAVELNELSNVLLASNIPITIEDLKKLAET